MRGSRVSTVGLIAALLVGAACSKGQPSAEAPASEPAVEPAGSIDIAVGPDVRSFGLGEAECSVVEAGGDSRSGEANWGEAYLNVTARAATIHTIEGQRVRPYLLSARLPADLGEEETTFGPERTNWGAVASLPGSSLEADDDPIIQVIARSVQNGPTDYECRASRTGQELSVVCNGGKLVPWSTAGPVPSGSFKATVNCKEVNSPRGTQGTRRGK